MGIFGQDAPVETFIHLFGVERSSSARVGGPARMPAFPPGGARLRHLSDDGQATGNYLNAQAGDSRSRSATGTTRPSARQSTEPSPRKRANLFLVRDGTLIHVAGSPSILHGITRDAIVQLAVE